MAWDAGPFSFTLCTPMKNVPRMRRNYQARDMNIVWFPCKRRAMLVLLCLFDASVPRVHAQGLSFCGSGLSHLWCMASLTMNDRPKQRGGGNMTRKQLQQQATGTWPRGICHMYQCVGPATTTPLSGWLWQAKWEGKVARCFCRARNREKPWNQLFLQHFADRKEQAKRPVWSWLQGHFRSPARTDPYCSELFVRVSECNRAFR